MSKRTMVFWSVLTMMLLLVTRPLAAAPLPHEHGEDEPEGVRLFAELSGEQEVPDPGDPDGRGTAAVRIDEEEGTLCFILEAVNITLPAAAAHIHEGAAGVAGPVVVPLEPPTENGTVEGCVAAENDEQRAILRDIVANPGNYYVNIHTSDFPGGAVRGQLARVELPGTGIADSPATVLGFALTLLALGILTRAFLRIRAA